MTATSDAGLQPGQLCPGGDGAHDQCTHPPGATLWLGGQAWAHPALQPQLLDVDELHLYPGNARRGDQPAITASVADLGIYKGQITYQATTWRILTGNHTYRALIDLGARLAPATPLRVDDARASAINARDNHTSDLGGYDVEAQLAQLDALASHDLLALAGFDEAALEALRAAGITAGEPRTEPDAAPEVPDVDPITRPGDLWELGRHRVLCGDATSSEDARRLLDGARAAMLFTDPPYGVSYVGKTRDRLTIANDALTPERLRALLDGAFTVAEEVLAPGGAFYVCAPSGPLEGIFRLAFDAAGLPIRQQLVWVKDRFVLGRSDYHHQHEPIFYGTAPGAETTDPPPFEVGHDTLLYGWKPGAAHTWVGGRKQSTVWEFDRPSASKVHPTMKPVALVQRAIENNTEPGALVLDLFAGSGPVVIACERARRTARVLELDPVYVDVICRRWQAHTGVVPVRDGQAVSFGDS